MGSTRFRSKAVLLTTEEWHAYFASHRNVLEAVPWNEGRTLTGDEKLRITSSVREFQLGESSEGRHLNEFARDYSREKNDPFYYETIKFFIREEQRHSQALGRFMEREGISRLPHSFVDSVFRYLRRYAGLELSITVLLMAEIISLVYYRALRAATGAPVLRGTCLELLKDERVHLRFHYERLVILRKNYGSLRLGLLGLFQTVLLSGTCLAVWMNHRKVLSTKGSFTVFWKGTWRIYEAVRLRMKRPSIRSAFWGDFFSSLARNFSN